MSSVLAATLVQHQNTSAADEPVGTFWAIVLLVVGAAWLVGMIAWGFVLVRFGEGRYVPAAIVFVTGALLAWYVVTMAFSPDDGADIAAGVGVVLGALPALLLVASIMGLGAGAGQLVRRRRIRRFASSA